MEPYCGKDVGNRTLGCTLDRGSVGLCSLTTLDEDVLADFRVSDPCHVAVCVSNDGVLQCSIFQGKVVDLWLYLIIALISGSVSHSQQYCD